MINCDAEGMTEHYPVLILLVPLFGALLATLLGSERQVACWFTALIALGGSSILAIGNICALLASARWHGRSSDYVYRTSEQRASAEPDNNVILFATAPLHGQIFTK